MPVFYCEDCGWEWPYDTLPAQDDECDNCGGDLVFDADDQDV